MSVLLQQYSSPRLSYHRVYVCLVYLSVARLPVGPFPLFTLLQAQREAEFAEAPGTITMEDLPAPPTNGEAAGGGGGGAAASRDFAPPSAGMTVPYAELKG